MADNLSETRISIRGETIQLRTDLPGEKLKTLATYVTNTMDRLDPKESLPAHKLSLLTSLSLAEEVGEVREAARQQTEKVRDRIAKLNAMLDEVLESR